jgi:hypothetical protein
MRIEKSIPWWKVFYYRRVLWVWYKYADWPRVAVVSALLICIGIFFFLNTGCGADLTGHATDGPHLHEHDTDCHDGTWCPPAYPQCPLPLSGRPCEAAGDPLLVDHTKYRGDAGHE